MNRTINQIRKHGRVIDFTVSPANNPLPCAGKTAAEAGVPFPVPASAAFFNRSFHEDTNSDRTQPVHG